MPLIKKIDVKNYREARRQQRAHRGLSTSVPDATGISGPYAGSTGPDLPVQKLSRFAEDFHAEHSSPKTADPLANPAAGSASPQGVAPSKSAQA